MTRRRNIAISGACTSRCCSRCFLRFSSQTSGSFTYLRTHTTDNAGRMPIHNMPRQPMESLSSAKISADIAKPMPQDPCSTPLMKPRDRTGQCSIASDAPAGHSAPMPMPSSARNRNRKPKLGEKPAMKLQTEYHRIEIINGIFRPTRSASQPEAVAPTRRNQRVMVNTAVTSVSGTLNSLAIGTMISRKMVKSNASSVQPSHAAHQAIHWSLVGSRHHGTDCAPTDIDMFDLPPRNVTNSLNGGRTDCPGGRHGWLPDTGRDGRANTNKHNWYASN